MDETTDYKPVVLLTCLLSSDTISAFSTWIWLEGHCFPCRFDLQTHYLAIKVLHLTLKNSHMFYVTFSILGRQRLREYQIFEYNLIIIGR